MTRTYWVVALGNPFDGLVLYGLFDGFDEALAWAQENRMGDDWNVVEVNEPVGDRP